MKVTKETTIKTREEFVKTRNGIKSKQLHFLVKIQTKTIIKVKNIWYILLAEIER